MFEPFGRNKNDNEGGGGGPRIVFANLGPASGPILTETGYKVFSATAFFGWALVVVIVWVFHVEVSLSQNSNDIPVLGPRINDAENLFDDPLGYV